MKSARAIFIKQARDTLKNPSMLIQFIIFPVMAFIMTEFVAKPEPEIPNSQFVTMFAAMFSGMSPLVMTATAIAEDRERRSLRFLVMAGVKPYEYLCGIGGVILLASAVMSLLFAFMGGFVGAEFWKFVAVIMLGSVASVILGATVGIFSKNQQAATALGMPIAMVLGFTPMLAMFNETVEKIFNVFYTMQMNKVAIGFSFEQTESMSEPVLIMLANIAVLTVLFILAFRMKGLRN